MKIRWDKQKISELKTHIANGLTNKEIANLYGVSRDSVSIITLRVLGGNPNYRNKITKHAHIREKVLEYYLTHTAIDTQKKFKLTASEFKSCLTMAYKIESLKHLRKETRRHDAWSSKEYKFLLQNAGLRSREWIAVKLKRGGELCIKDRLEMLGISSKNLNGITISQFREAFGCDPGFYIQSKAGPKRVLKSGFKNTPSYYKIIPWIYLEKEISEKRLKTHRIFEDLISAMALFQNWCFEGKAYEKLVEIRTLP